MLGGQMKQMIIVAMIMVVGLSFLPAQQGSGMEYTVALQKKGMERVKALEDYIKKYPDASANDFTKYAYYWLAIEYYNQKRFGDAIKNGEKGLATQLPDKKNEADLFLMLANAYGVSESPRFDKGQAEKYADKAINLARAEGFAQIQKNAESVKKALSGESTTVKKPVTNTDKINVMYNGKKYSEAVSFYQSLPEGDKKNQTILEIFADSLFQLKRYSEAMAKFEEAYKNSKKGMTALRLADICENLGKKEAKYTDMAVSYYAEASLLFGKEKNAALQDNSMKKAKFIIGEKYNYNKRAAEVNKKMPKNNTPKPNNDREIKKLEIQYQQVEADINRRYPDMEPPSYELDKLTAIEKKIANLKSGASTATTSDPNLQKEIDALEKDQKKIDEEYRGVLEKARKKLGM